MNHPQQQESWSSFTVEGGGYIEFKDEENQKKCMALIQELISTERQRVLGEVRELVEGIRIKGACPECGSGGNEKIEPGVIDCHFCGVVEVGEEECQYNQALDGLLSAIKEMEDKTP